MINLSELIKYPRTHHLVGSKLQDGDEDLSQIPASMVLNRFIVIEEKIDGANTAISFDNDGNLLLQSRGHYLTGGNRERHYNLFKNWATVHKDALFNILGSRYIMYGEWLYAKHTIYYDALPHYFLEFDIYDREKKVFLDTKTRHKMLKGSPVVSVPVLDMGIYKNINDITKYVVKSNYITDNHIKSLESEAAKANYDPDKALLETDNSNLMEGLYIKVEENGIVVDRMKYVRYSFLQTVTESNTHWQNRTIIPNKLAYDLWEIFNGSNV